MTSFFSRFSPVPSFPHYTGPYDVGTLDVEIPTKSVPSFTSSATPEGSPATVAFRIFYPCERPVKPSRPVYWIQKPQRNIIAAYAQFLGASSTFSNFLALFTQQLYHITIPAHRAAQVYTPSGDSTRWPVCIFSHGLGGSRNAYSHICGSLASHGLIVIAPDHRDGSQPISYVRATDSTEASTVDYRHISHDATPEVYRARDDQLKIRLWELGNIMEIIKLINNGEDVLNLDPNNNTQSQSKQHSMQQTNGLNMFKNRLELSPGKISFAGHSFGAATTIQLLKTTWYFPETTTPLFSPRKESAISEQITPSTPTILLDPWALPMASPDTTALAALPMPCFSPSGSGGSALLAILSEAFHKWNNNFRGILRALEDPESSSHGVSNRPPAHIFYPAKSAHLSQSDFGLLFPNITKWLAKAPEPERMLRLNVRAILEVMRRGGVQGLSGLDKEVTLENKNLQESSDSSLTAENDWRILSPDPNVVRGWIHVPAAPIGQNITKEADSVEAVNHAVDTEAQSQRQQPNRRSSTSTANKLAEKASAIAGAAQHESKPKLKRDRPSFKKRLSSMRMQVN